MTDLIVETNGHCCLCLNKISPPTPIFPPPVPNKLEHGEVEMFPGSFHSIKCLSEYLKLDLRKVFQHSRGSILPPCLNGLENNEGPMLKVELCEGCASLTEKFSELYQQLKKIEIGMGSCVQLIKGKLLEAQETGKTDLFRTAAVKLGSGGKLDIVEALRSEALDKCSSSRLRSVDQELFDSTFEAQPEFAAYQSDMKIEYSSSHRSVDEETTDYLGMPDVDMENAEPSSPGSPEVDVKLDIKIKSSERSSPKKSGPQPHLPYSILPHTGHYKCDICSRTFPKYDTFRQHHNTAHLHFKYKCTDCGKEFQHRGNYYRHRQRMHEKVRVKCDICNKAFPKGYIEDHRRETHGKGKGEGSSKPSKKHACEICGNEYKHSSSLRNHLRKDH